MRLTLSHRSWAWLAVCALSGCTTFDRPVASSRIPDARQDQRLQDDVNRRVQAGDYEGAKQLLEQADREKGGAPGRSHAKSDAANDSGIQTVGYETTAVTREDMIRELVKNQPQQRQLQEAQRYRDMPLSTLRQLYHSHQQATALGHQQSKSHEDARTPVPSANAGVEAPNPRGTGFGGTTPWPVSQNPFAANTTESAANAVPSPEATVTSAINPTAAATLAVTDTGVRLSGIQTGSSQGGTAELPSINPATPGSTLLPVITPRRGSVPATVAPAQPTNEPANAIEQVTGTVPTSLPPTMPNAGGANAGEHPANSQMSGQANSVPGSPATLPGTLEPLQKPTGPTAPGIDRFKPKLPNPLPTGMQRINQTAKSALDRTLGLGFSPPTQVDPNVSITPSGGDVSGSLGALINSLETQLAASAPGATEADKLEYVRRHVNLRMLYLMAGQNDRAVEPIKGLDADEQEFWQYLVWSIANYFDAQGLPRASERASQTVAKLRTATLKLKSQADLELRNVTFCQRIDSYGNFERLSRDQFPPGSAVLLYAEVENFSCMSAEGDRQMTALKSTIEFFKAGVASEKPIQTIPFKVTQDYCRTKRRDFYLAFEFSIPQQLEAGVYTLVLKTEDQVGKKVATSRVNFTVE